MSFITKTCLYCTNTFDASLKEHNRGNAKFCSLTCSARFHGQQRPKPKPNMTCSYCQTMFYRNASKQKNSKTGFQFCSRECKDKAQQIKNFDTFSAMMPNHYGEVSTRYRVLAFRDKPKICEECGYDKVPEVLQVHHIDRDRKHNVLENLKVLCPTCHEVDHFLAGDGRWSGGV